MHHFGNYQIALTSSYYRILQDIKKHIYKLLWRAFFSCVSLSYILLCMYVKHDLQYIIK